MLKLILGRSGCGKSTMVMSRLCQRMRERPQVLLVPDQNSHQGERLLCHMGGDSASQYAEVLSFGRLANRILMTAGGAATTELDGGGRLLLMYQAVKSASPQLTTLARVSRRPAFLEQLVQTVDELKTCCVRPTDLVEAVDGLEDEAGEKLRDLALICQAYNDSVAALEHVDPRDRLTRATEKLRRCKWAQGRDFWVDGFTDFTPQQLEILEELIIQGGDVNVTITCDSLDSDDDLFSAGRRTAFQLKKRSQKHEVEYLPQRQEGRSPALVYLEGALFAQNPTEQAPSGDGVALFAGHSARSEVEWTAAQILSLVREKGYRFREIGVVARDFAGYSALISTVFARYDVPVFCSAMTDILDKPVLTLVVSALNIVSGGYQYEDVFTYLKTGLTNLPQDDCDQLENYVLKWHLRGSRWTQEKAWDMHPRGFGIPMDERSELKLKELNRARVLVASPLETLRKSGAKTGQAQARALYEFLERIALPHQLAERVTALELRGELALAGEYKQLWQILCGALDQCAQLLGDTPMELTEFAGVFRLVLSQYDVGTIPVALDQVTAGEATRQTGHRVRALFLLGAEDGTIPMVTGDSGLLSDDDRSLLASYGHQMGQTGEERLQREMTTVYQVCSLPSEQLTVTWPAQGGGGEERRPCFLVERLRLLLPDVKTVDEEMLDGAFRLVAPRPALEQAGQNPSLRAALKAHGDYAQRVERLEEMASRERGTLSKASVKALYGDKVPMSASRMDQYKSCHFGYFMRYGLRAEPRTTAGFSAPEYGTFIHFVLERVMKSNLWDDTENAERPEQLRTLVDGAVDDYIDDQLGGLDNKTDRFRYLFSRLSRAVYVAAENAVEELDCSKFRPAAFELGFARDGEIPPVELTADGITISISGYIDRVDSWQNEEKTYLRVVDYKTGKKTFDFTDISNGMGLQMLLYLFTLKKCWGEVSAQIQQDAPTGDVVGAGALYVPARDVIVQGSSSMTDAAWHKALDKELVRRGILLSDSDVRDAMEHRGDGDYRFLPIRANKAGEVSGDALVSSARMEKLEHYVNDVLTGICGELSSGNIDADPFWFNAEKNACCWCDFPDACQFEEGQVGDCRRQMKTVKAADFWKRVEPEEEETE